MAKPILLAGLLAAASIFTASALNVNTAVERPIIIGEAPEAAPASPVSEGYWSHLFSAPYGDCPSAMFGISCMNTSNCFIPAGIDGVGFGVMRFDGTPGGKFVPMDMPSKPLMLMAIGMGGDKTAPRGAVGGMGYGNVVQYLKDGHTWHTADLGDAPEFFPTQNIRASADGRRILTVVAETMPGELPMVLYSTNAGQNFTAHRVTVPFAAQGGKLRYAAIPSEDVWYISAGAWPKATEPEDAIFNPPTPAQLRAGARGGLSTFALSERLAVTRDATGKLTYTVRDMLKKQRKAKEEDPSLGRPYSAQIFRTTDGGKTFKSVFESVDLFYFNGIECSDVKTCYAVGSGDKAVYIYATKDGGDSWRVAYEMPRVNGAHYSLMSIGVSDGTVIAAGGGQTAKGYESFIVTSDDAGETWNRMEGLPHIGDVAGISLLPGGFGYGTAITVYQSSTVIALRPKGSPTLPPPPTYATFKQVSCTDDKCSENCQAAAWRQHKCLSIGGGRSVIAFCDVPRQELVQDFYDSPNCAGNATRRPMPINVCLKADENNYYENVC